MDRQGAGDAVDPARRLSAAGVGLMAVLAASFSWRSEGFGFGGGD